MMRRQTRETIITLVGLVFIMGFGVTLFLSAEVKNNTEKPPDPGLYKGLFALAIVFLMIGVALFLSQQRS